MPSNIFVGIEALHVGVEGDEVQHRKVKESTSEMEWLGRNFFPFSCQVLFLVGPPATLQLYHIPIVPNIVLEPVFHKRQGVKPLRKGSGARTENNN